MLLNASQVPIERIISQGHASPEGFWYDQPRQEWIIVLQGAAWLRFENEAEAIAMNPGDSIGIPARKRHRVEWTSPDEPTVWLAVHYGEELPTVSLGNWAPGSTIERIRKELSAERSTEPFASPAAQRSMVLPLVRLPQAS